MSEQQNDTKVCPGCKKHKPISEFYKVRTRKDGLSHKCKKCLYTKTRSPEALATKKRYAEANKEKLKQYAENWRKKNRTWKRKRERLYKLKRKIEVINHYGGKCACCGEKEMDFLAIDHIKGNGSQHRKKIGVGGSIFYHWLRKSGWPKGFRVLCHNCNWGIHVNHGICPHKKKLSKEETI